MDKVIDETMRLYPPVAIIEREANEDYIYNETKIPKGTVLSVPIWALHHDSQVYPEPYKFLPDRYKLTLINILNFDKSLNNKTF
jgi:cytochrome P450